VAGDPRRSFPGEISRTAIVGAVATVCASPAAIKIKTVGAVPFRQAWASVPAKRTMIAIAKAATIDAKELKAPSLRRRGDLQSSRT